jgi:hypothetical protein
MESFYSCFISGEKPESNSLLAADTITCIYTAYASARNKGAEEKIPLLH